MRSHTLPTTTAVLCAVLTSGCARPPAPPVAPAAVPVPESVLMRLHLRASDARRYALATTMYIHLGAGEPPAGDSLIPMMQMTQFVTESVTTVAGDTFTIAFIHDSSRMTTPFAAGTTPLPDSLLPRGLMMTMRMDPRRRVMSLQLERSVLLGGQQAVMRRFLHGRDSAGSQPDLGAAGLPDRPVRRGDTWSDTMPCPRLLRCEADIVSASRLDSITGSGGSRTAFIYSSGDVPRQTVDTPMALSTGPMHVIGGERLDLDEGWTLEREMTMTGPSRTPMGDLWMRVQSRQTAMPSPPAGAAGTPPAIPSMPRGFLMQPATIPAPTTLDSLIALFRHYEPTLEFPACTLPEVSPGADWVTLLGPDDGVQVRLPQGWRAATTDTTPRGDAEAVLLDTLSDRIEIARVTRASGLQHLMKAQSYGMPTELPHTARCRLGGGTAGSVWTLYAPDPDASGGPSPAYGAMGSLITATGRRYEVSVRAASAEARDRFVRLVADAVRPPR